MTEVMKSQFARHKFHAKPTGVDGIRFHSKKEANRYKDLVLLRQAGHVLFFLRQVPFDLPGNTKYLADFLVFWSDGSVTVEDVKGYRTSEYKLKRRQVQQLYPIQIMEK